MKHEVKESKAEAKSLAVQVNNIENQLSEFKLEEVDYDEEENGTDLETSMDEMKVSESQKENEMDTTSDTQETETENTNETGTNAAGNSSGKSNQRQLHMLTDEQLAEEDHGSIDREIEIFTCNLKKLEGKVNIQAIQEYKQKNKIYLEKIEELNKVTKLRNDKRKLKSRLENKRVDEFLTGFNQIKLKLKEMYQMITLGGDADLDLVDHLDPFSEGVKFTVRPKDKSWKAITNLSGGEKTLSSLALVFALHYYKPTPFYVMDEIDAALGVLGAKILY